MSLNSTQILSGKSIQRTQAREECRLSLVVLACAYQPVRLKLLLAELLAAHDSDVELLIVQTGRDLQVDSLVLQDPRLSILKVPLTHDTPAIAINAALDCAIGNAVRYFTGVSTHVFFDDENDLDGIEHQRFLRIYADPHLLLKSGWRADLHSRLCQATGRLCLTSSECDADFLVQCALNRNRSKDLASQNVHKLDILDGSFLPNEESLLQFRENWVIPFVCRNFSSNHQLSEHLIATRPVRFALNGAIGSAGAEIIYGNYERRFPGLLRINRLSDARESIDPSDEDMLVNYRYSGPINSSLHSSFREERKPVLYAMDDNLLRLTEHPSFAREPWLSNAQNVKAHVIDADAVLTWSNYCASDVRSLNPRAFVLRTNIRAERLSICCSLSPRDNRLVYTTLTQNVLQRSHWWDSVALEWSHFFREHSDVARLVLFGSDPDLLDFYERLFAGIKYDVVPPMPYERYLNYIAQHEFHFVMAQVVEETKFVRSKCPIKFLEATSCGAVLLASDVSAYSEISDQKEALKVASQGGSWLSVLNNSLRLSDIEREQIWNSAHDLIRESFTTESQLISVLLSWHSARLHAVLKSSCSHRGRARVMVLLPESSTKRRSLITWAWQLRRQGFRISLVASNNFTMSLLTTSNQDPVALVIVDTPWSRWISVSRQKGIPCAAICDINDFKPDSLAPDLSLQPDVLLARGVTTTMLARKLGWRCVRRVEVPVTGGKGWSASTGSIQVEGNGGAVIDAVLCAMIRGHRISYVNSRDAAELLPDSIWPGSANAKGVCSCSGKMHMVASAWVNPVRIAHDLVCALVEACRGVLASKSSSL